jgi:hypothetical protein
VNISLDMHGVIDRDPTMFTLIAQKVIDLGGSVIILSGSLPEDLILSVLKYHIPYTGLASVTQYLLSEGYSWELDKHKRPSFSTEIWNQGKANIIRKLNAKRRAPIDIHIDDTAIYGETFPEETLFYHYTGEQLTYEILLERLASRSRRINQVLESSLR